MRKEYLYIFRWNGLDFVCDSFFGITLYDVLAFLNLNIDPDTQFSRINRGNTQYLYRRCNSYKITLTIYEQDPKIGN